jgi:DNA repair protein RecO (recombination protein O)
MVDRFSLQNAYLLHRRNFRETSLVLDVFSRDHGIRRLIAKGAMRGKGGGRSALLQPFVPLGLGWTLRGEPAVLTTAEPLGQAVKLVGKTLFCGFYLNELLVNLLPEQDPHPEVFGLYQQTLTMLETGIHIDETLRGFELALLEELGYGLILDHDVETGAALRPESYYEYRIEFGPVISETGAAATRGSTLLGLSQGILAEPESKTEAKRLMRRVLNHYLGGRPLKSRELFKYSLY